MELKSNEPAFLDENPLDIMLSGRYNKVPMIVGYNSCEGMFFELIKSCSEKPIDFETMIPLHFKIKRGSIASRQIAEKIKRFYVQDKEYIKLSNEDILVR